MNLRNYNNRKLRRDPQPPNNNPRMPRRLTIRITDQLLEDLNNEAQRLNCKLATLLRTKLELKSNDLNPSAQEGIINEGSITELRRLVGFAYLIINKYEALINRTLSLGDNELIADQVRILAATESYEASSSMLNSLINEIVKLTHTLKHSK